ncbi:hypothetical protein B0H13DRAFT_2267160, partial [Mycena leptocephala]
MSMAPSAIQQCLEANPDISGVGVRISFYVQTIILVFWAERSPEEALNSGWTLLGTSFALVASALWTAVRNQLPLYQAIIVTDLVWLFSLSTLFTLRTYDQKPRGSRTIQYAAILQTYISMSSILYLWVRAPALESEGHKGQTVFVVYFLSTHATGKGRIIALVSTAILFVVYSV